MYSRSETLLRYVGTVSLASQLFHQDTNETVPTYLKRVSDLHSELEQAGQAMSEELVATIAVKGLSPKYSSVEEEASRNALYASTSPTGESTSGLVIKSLSDVAKACRAIDVTPVLQKHGA